MKNYLLLFLSFVAIDVLAQTDCDPQIIEISNGVRTNINATAGAIACEGTYSTVLEAQTYMKSLWLGGFDAANNLRMAANTYFTPNSTDFYAGPLDPMTGLALLDHCEDFKKLWKFSKTELDTLRIKFLSGTLEEGDLSEDVLTYPGRKNAWYSANLGVELNHKLAPFFDQNNDAIYNPMDGDIPIPLEEKPTFIPFQFSFTIYHDAEEHTSSKGNPFLMEIHQTSYILFVEGNNLLNQTVFNRLKLINRDAIGAYDFKIGFFTDDEVGSDWSDNYSGCIPALQAVYTYNQNGVDRVDGSTGVKLHLWLNRELQSCQIMDLNPFNNPPPATGTPVLASEYWNFLNGLWSDGTPITVGGLGYNQNSTETTYFAFPDSPSDPNGWSMQTANLPDNDYRMISVIDEGFVEYGGTRILDLADVSLIDTSTTGFEKIDDLENIVGQIKDYYQSELVSSTEQIGRVPKSLILFPNPAADRISLSLPLDREYNVVIYNVQARKLSQSRLSVNQSEISIENLPKGILIVKATDKKGRVYIGRCAKM